MVEFSSLEEEFDDKKLKQLSRKASSSSFSKQSSSYNHVADSTRKMEKMRQRRTSATVQKIMGWYPTATSTEQHAEKEDIESPLELLTERVAVLADELPPESPNEKRRSPSSLRRSSTVRKAPSVRRTTTIRRKSTRLGMFQHIEQVEQQDKEEQHVDDYLKAHRRAQRLIPCTIKVQACWRMKVRFRIYEKYKHRKIFKRNTVFRIWRLSYLARRLSRRALSRTIWRLWTREVDVAKTLRLFEIKLFERSLKTNTLSIVVSNLFFTTSSSEKQKKTLDELKQQALGNSSDISSEKNLYSTDKNNARSMHTRMKNTIRNKLMLASFTSWKNHIDNLSRNTLDASICLKRAARLVFGSSGLYSNELLMIVLQMWHRYVQFKKCKKNSHAVSLPAFTCLPQWDAWLRAYQLRQFRVLQAKTRYPLALMRRMFINMKKTYLRQRSSMLQWKKACRHDWKQKVLKIIVSWKKNAATLSTFRSGKRTAFRGWYNYILIKSTTRPKKAQLLQMVKQTKMARIWKIWDIAYLRTTMLTCYKLSLLVQKSKEMVRYLYAWNPTAFPSQFERWQSFMRWKGFWKRRQVWRRTKYYGGQWTRKELLLRNLFTRWKRWQKSHIGALPSLRSTASQFYSHILHQVPELSSGASTVVTTLSTVNNVHESTTCTHPLLHTHIQQKNVSAVREYLSSGSSISVLDLAGNTPLHIAIQMLYDDPHCQHTFTMIVFLLECGADPTICNLDNTSCLQNIPEESSTVLKLLQSVTRTSLNCHSSTNRFYSFYADEWGALDTTQVWYFCSTLLSEMARGKRRPRAFAGIPTSFNVISRSTVLITNHASQKRLWTPTSLHAHSVYKHKAFTFAQKHSLFSIHELQQHQHHLKIRMHEKRTMMLSGWQRDASLLGAKKESIVISSKTEETKESKEGEEHSFAAAAASDLFEKMDSSKSLASSIFRFLRLVVHSKELPLLQSIVPVLETVYCFKPIMTARCLVTLLDTKVVSPDLLPSILQTLRALSQDAVTLNITITDLHDVGVIDPLIVLLKDDSLLPEIREMIHENLLILQGQNDQDLIAVPEENNMQNKDPKTTGGSLMTRLALVDKRGMARSSVDQINEVLYLLQSKKKNCRDYGITRLRILSKTPELWNAFLENGKHNIVPELLHFVIQLQAPPSDNNETNISPLSSFQGDILAIIATAVGYSPTAAIKTESLLDYILLHSLEEESENASLQIILSHCVDKESEGIVSVKIEKWIKVLLHSDPDNQRMGATALRYWMTHASDEDVEYSLKYACVFIESLYSANIYVVRGMIDVLMELNRNELYKARLIALGSIPALVMLLLIEDGEDDTEVELQMSIEIRRRCAKALANIATSNSERKQVVLDALSKVENWSDFQDNVITLYLEMIFQTDEH